MEALCEGDTELAQRYNDFWLACYNGDVEAVTFYLEVEELDHAAAIPIGWSTKHNKQLRGGTPLHIAVDGNFNQVAKLLLATPMMTWGVVIAKPTKEQLDLQKFYNKKKNTVKNGSRQKQKLDFTVHSNYFNKNNDEDSIDENLKLNILVKDNQGMTPLLIAIKRGNFKMVNMLIKHDKTNYHINECRDLRGANAMHYACQVLFKYMYVYM
jgi:ankyrin repeat protein